MSHPSAAEISVVLPVRNAADTIDAQLGALKAQEIDCCWELVVVDNGSSDDTAQRIGAWTTRLPSLRLVSAPECAGPYAARNLGAQLAGADLLAFCDADDAVDPGWLAAVRAELGRGELVTGPIRIDALNQPALVRWQGETNWTDSARWHRFLPVALGSNLGMRRTLFDRLGGFAEWTSGADVEFVWRAQIAGAELRFADRASVQRREPATWRAQLRRAYRYGRSEPLLFAAFRDQGMPRSRLGDATLRWFGVLVGWPALAADRWRYAWLHTAGQRAGRLVGSVRVRVFFP